MLVADTSVVYSALVTSDRHHRACADLLGAGDAIVLPAPVVVELGLLGGRRLRPDVADRLLMSIADGSVLVVDPDREGYVRIRQLVSRYADLPLDIVDASVVAIAERLEQDTIATLDRRHFSVVRPLHVPAFTLVPELN